MRTGLTVVVSLLLLCHVAWAQTSLAYDEQLGKVLAMASAGAYANDPAKCVPNTFQVLDTFSGKIRTSPVFGYIAYESRVKALVLSFRGTEDGAQLVDELLHAYPVPFDGHHGVAVAGYFYDAFKILAPAMYNAYHKAVARYPNATLYVTGHSLGGAIASLASIDILSKTSRNAPTYLYSFGAPRVGNYTLSVLFGQKFPQALRVVNAGDLVAHMPPCSAAPNKGCATTKGSLWWSFHHGSEVWYQKSMPDWSDASTGSWKMCTTAPLGEDSSCSNSLSPLFDIPSHLKYYGLHLGQYCLKREIKEAFLQREASNLAPPALQASADAFERRWQVLEDAEAARQQKEVEAVIARWQQEMRSKHSDAALHAEQPELF